MGTKRKRPEADVGSTPQDQSARSSTTIQHELQARTAIDKGHKLLFRAFKTARGFERQKLGRRRKTASSAVPEVVNEDPVTQQEESAGQEPEAKPATTAISRIDAETTALKTLDLTHVTTNYLIKSLLKYKEVAESPSLPGFFRRTAPAPTDTPSLNVVARLCNSNPVREALSGIVKEVTAALGVQIHVSGKSKTKVKGEKNGTREPEKQNGPTDDRAVDQAVTEPLEDEDEFQGFDDDIAASASDMESEADEATVRNRIASLRASLTDPLRAESDSENDSSDEMGRASLLQSRRALSTTPSPSPTPSPDPDLAPSDSEPDDDHTHTRIARSKPSTGPITSTTFLPSLTMGGYISGSDSDGFEPDADTRDELKTKPKSNRRGQRARRAIWEAKYGEKAKHLGAAEGQKAGGRDQGWDAKRGATDGKRFGQRGGRGGGRGGSRGGGSGGGHAARGESSGPPAKKRVKDDEGPLHPSWVAAKKAKEARAVVNAPFQGKRVTFD